MPPGAGGKWARSAAFWFVASGIEIDMSPRKLIIWIFIMQEARAVSSCTRVAKLPRNNCLITSQMMDLRDGDKSVADLMSMGQQLLGRNQVMEGVPELIPDVQIEGTFPDGTKLPTVHSPIAPEDGDLELALAGSFLPVPSLETFQRCSPADVGEYVPGEVMPCETSGDIEINAGASLIEIEVANTGDRPIQGRDLFTF